MKLTEGWFGFIIFMILTVILVSSSIMLGIDIGKGNNLLSIGCWRQISETERAIIMRVEERPVYDMIDTCRHELCHEIEFRRTGEFSQNETFAETCNPEDYLEGGEE